VGNTAFPNVKPCHPITQLAFDVASNKPMVVAAAQGGLVYQPAHPMQLLPPLACCWPHRMQDVCWVTWFDIGEHDGLSPLVYPSEHLTCPELHSAQRMMYSSSNQLQYCLRQAGQCGCVPGSQLSITYGGLQGPAVPKGPLYAPHEPLAPLRVARLRQANTATATVDVYRSCSYMATGGCVTRRGGWPLT
jgi:hypothetical protein